MGIEIEGSDVMTINDESIHCRGRCCIKEKNVN
jgi:hypothetical protein